MFRHLEHLHDARRSFDGLFPRGVPDKNNYRRYRMRTVEGQDDFASMAEVVRRRYSRILLEARAANSDAAEFSQENAADALARISSHPERSEAKLRDPAAKRNGMRRDSSTPLGMTRTLSRSVCPT